MTRHVQPSARLGAAALALAFLLTPGASQAKDDASKPASGLVNYPRGGPERNGAFPDVHLPERPETVWVDDLGKNSGSLGVGQPVVAGDRLILGNRRGDLIALSLKDGAEVWASIEPGWDVMVAPVVVGDRVYCASNRAVTAHAPKDGAEVWRQDIAGGATGSSPLVLGGLVVAGGSDGSVYAWDAASGEERWKADVVTGAPPDPPGFDGARARIGNDAARPGTAASDGRAVFVPLFDQARVVALDLKTGEPRWSFQTKGWVGAGPTAGGGKVFIGSQDYKVYALDAATGKELWAFKTRSRADGDLAYCEGSVFACASDGRCYRIDAETGKQVWEYETPVGPDGKHFFLSGAPLVDATAVYFGSWDGHLYALNRKDGSLKWKHRPDVNNEQVGAPVTDGKRLYVPLSPHFDFDKQKDKEGVHGVAAIGAKP